MALPWAQRDPDARTPPRWDCPSCMGSGDGSRSEGVRAFMHCGYMDRTTWPAGDNDLPPSLGPFPYTADVCPGWLVRQPEVGEGARAYRAREKNALHIFDPLGLNVIWEMTEAADLAFSAFEGEKLREVSRKGGRS